MCVPLPACFSTSVSGNALAAGGDEIFGILETFDVDALVRAIPAGDVAEVAADAFIGMDAWR